jgi:RND family efflux transporter MFP subunit
MKPATLSLTLGVVGALAAGLWLAMSQTMAQEQSVAPVATAPVSLPVRTETVIETPALTARRFIGRLEPASTVDIAFQVAGQILEILPEEGQRVAAGSTIARLDPVDYQLGLSRAEAVLKLARSEEARVAELVARKVAPEAELDRARAELAQAEVAFDQARRALEQTTIEAPFDALVARRLAEPFANTSPAAPVLRLQDVSRLYVAVSLPEDLAQLARSQPEAFEAVARFPALPDLAVPVMLDRFVTEADPVAQTYLVKLALNAPDPRLLPGMTATVEVRPRLASAAVSVPVSAVDTASGASPRIWVVDADGTVQPREVELGLPQGDRVVVTRGLSPGEKVVTAGWGQLTAGAAVHPALL